jgi:hypothetical protein
MPWRLGLENTLKYICRHNVGFRGKLFGRGQIIRRDPASGVLWAGSDPRVDGCAMAAG